MEKIVKIETEFITLGQILKFAKLIDNGGEAKIYLAEHLIKVNGENESRRGKKLRPGDRIEIDETIELKVE